MLRAPRPVLRPFVESLWAIDDSKETRTVSPHREHVLPTGQMHLVFRLSGEPLRLFANTTDLAGTIVGDAVVGGARDTFYIRDVSRALRSVGAQLRPGAARVLFGVPAGDLAGRHTPLGDLWGGAVAELRERLSELRTPDQRIDALEAMLIARIPRPRGLHPAVAHALQQFAVTSDVHHVVCTTGYSHRTLVSLFRDSVGLTPKRYCRVLRFQRALKQVFREGAVSLSDLALAAGYSDQAHFTREFREFTGVSPTEYRRISPRVSHHLPTQPQPLDLTYARNNRRRGPTRAWIGSRRGPTR